MHKLIDRGFTLIELMIVLAIMSILATMAVPSYQDRIIRTQVTESAAIAEVAMSGVEAFYKEHHGMPENNESIGLPPAEKMIGNYITGVTVENGTVHMVFGNRVNTNVSGETLTFRPAVVENEPQVPIAWIKGHASVPKGMTAKGENRTSLEARHLPMAYRY